MLKIPLPVGSGSFFSFFFGLKLGLWGSVLLDARSLSKRGNFGRLRARFSYSSSYGISLGSWKRES